MAQGQTAEQVFSRNTAGWMSLDCVPQIADQLCESMRIHDIS